MSPQGVAAVLAESPSSITCEPEHAVEAFEIHEESSLPQEFTHELGDDTVCETEPIPIPAPNQAHSASQAEEHSSLAIAHSPDKEDFYQTSNYCMTLSNSPSYEECEVATSEKESDNLDYDYACNVLQPTASSDSSMTKSQVLFCC